MRIFRTNRESAIRLSLRKLHTRWWHASEHTMRRFLERVGVAQKVLDLIPEVVQTCRVCREWAKPGPSNACSVELPDKFNHQVECDLLFVHKFVIFHLIDRCTRWHAASIVPNKEEETLQKAIDTTWVTIHGPPRELITDGETGIVMSNSTNEYLSRKGIKLHPRGKDQHARYIERRGALLRDTIHKVEGQLAEEGVAGTPFESILAECVFCGNALLTVGGSTPYNALYGRVPNILPSLDQIVPPEEAGPPNQGSLRDAHRLREISVQAMVEGSARTRLGRALNTRTTPAGQLLDLKVGDEVDFFRSAANKDTPGWFGPAEVIDASKVTRGTVTVRWQSRVMTIQLPNIRKHLHFFMLLGCQENVCEEISQPVYNVQDNVWSRVKSEIEQLAPGRLVQLGRVKTGENWTATANNSHHAELWSAVKHLAANHLQLNDVVSARVGVGLRELPAIKGYAGSTVIMWRPKGAYVRTVELQPGLHGVHRLKLSDEHKDWPHLRILQLLTAANAEAAEEAGGGWTTEASTTAPSASTAEPLPSITEENQVKVRMRRQCQKPAAIYATITTGGRCTSTRSRTTSPDHHQKSQMSPQRMSKASAYPSHCLRPCK